MQFFLTGASSATILLSTYASLSQDGTIRKEPLFLPFFSELLIETDLPQLPKKSMLIELPPTNKVTRGLLFSLSSLRQEGYRIVLGGFALQLCKSSGVKHASYGHQF